MKPKPQFLSSADIKTPIQDFSSIYNMLSKYL
jgi:hypothetical protein